MTEKKRNTYVDFLRGIAMLLVVLGHTVLGSTRQAADSLIYNIIWSLQMPLFILISGYVSRYSKKPSKGRELGAILLRRTLSYLLPWFVFTVLINGFFLRKQELSADKLFWHMDDGYWFLITIWTISVLFVFAQFFAEKVRRGQTGNAILTVIFVAVGMGLLAAVGFAVGLSFWCIKLTLYYTPFYILGYLFGYYQEALQNNTWYPKVVQAVVAAATAFWIFSIVKFKLFELDDGRIADIILRAATSVCGCVCVCGLMAEAFKKTPQIISCYLTWFGKHTIEIYLLHYYVLCLVAFSPVPLFGTMRGVGTMVLNYLLTVTLVSFITWLLSGNRYISLILFGKRLKQ